MQQQLLKKSESQMIKGIAILSVIMSHMSYIMKLPTKMELLIHPLGYLGVSLFLGISGYGCAISIKDKRWESRLKFLVHRIKKIVPLLATVTFVSILIADIVYNQKYDEINILVNMLGISNSIGRFTWYIGCQYFWYIIVILLWVKRLNWCWIGTIVVYFISILVNCSEIQFNMWGLNSISFPIGVWIALYEDVINKNIKFKKKKTILFSFIIWILLFVICYFILGNPEDLKIQNLFKSFISALFIIVIFEIFFFFRIENLFIGKILKFIGNISYELYLVHGFWVFLLYDFFEPIKLWKIIIYIVGSFLISLFIHRIYNRKIIIMRY